MKRTSLKGITRRAMALVLAALTLAPLSVLPPLARADEAKYNATTTPITVWEKLDPNVDDPQNYIKQSNYKDPKAKWDRIMIYKEFFDLNQPLSNYLDYHFFNTDGQKGADMDANYIYQEDDRRVNHPSHSEWSQDFKDYDKFVTVTGLATPYVEYTGNKTYSTRKGASHHTHFETCRLWLANKSDDTRSSCELAFVGNDVVLPPKLEVIRHSASDRHVEWIITNGTLIRASGRWEGENHFTIWQQNENAYQNDNITKGYNYFTKYRINTLVEVEYWGLCMGKTWNVPTLSADYSIDGDQISTLGRPMFYVPEGRTITVKAGGILSIDGVLLNDGTINVEEGGLLILKDNAKIFPFSRNKDVGRIVSRGSVVVETNAVLCGGAVNGVSIEGGGVVNFGIICAQQLNITAPNLVENRKSGYVVAGRALSRKDRIYYISDAAAGVTTTKPDVNGLVQYSSSLECRSTFAENAVYGFTDQVRRYGGQATAAVPAVIAPKMTVYIRDNPDAVNTPLVSDVAPNAVKFRTVNGKPVVTVGKTDHDVSNKLVSATVSRGDRGSEKIFEDRWAGGLQNAYVRITRPTDTKEVLTYDPYAMGAGTMLGVGPNAGMMTQWWQLVDAGIEDGNQTYYIDSCFRRSAVPGMTPTDPLGANDIWGMAVRDASAAQSGESVLVRGRGSGAGKEQKWILVDAGGGDVYIRSAADPGMGLTYVPDAGNVTVSDPSTFNPYMELAAAESKLQLRPKNDSDLYQRWRLNEFLNAQNYNSTVSAAAAVEMSPLSDADRRLDGRETANSGAVGLVAQDNSAKQRWSFEQAGSDDLGGMVTPYYRVANASTGMVLTVKDDQASANTPVVSETVNERSGSGQFWYVTQIKSGEYAIRPRGDTGLALAVDKNVTVLQPDSGKANQRWKLIGKANLALTDAAEAPAEEEDPYDGKVLSFTSDNAPDMRIEVVGDAEKGTAELQLQPARAAESQLWAVERAGSVFRGTKLVPYYDLRSLSDGRYLDSGAPGAGGGNGDARPSLAAYNESGDDAAMSQQWFLEDLGGGRVSIVPRSASAKNIAVESGAKNAGAAVVIRDKGDAADERWTAELSVEPEVYGAFSLMPRHAAGMAAGVAGSSNDNNANIQLTPAAGSKYNNWVFEKMGTDEKLGDYYRVRSEGSGKAMDVPGVNAPKAGANVRQNDYDGYGDQLWYLQEAETGRGGAIYYYVANYADPELVLEAADAGTGAGTDLRLQTKTRSDSQLWQLAVQTPAADLGAYEIVPAAVTGLRLHILDDSGDDGKNICIDRRLGDPLDQWRLIRRGSDTVDGKPKPYYSIENVDSKKVLDLPDEGEKAARAGASVRQWSYDGRSDQHWYMEAQSDSSVVFRSRANSDLVLTIEGTGYNSDVRLGEYSSGDKSQRWQLHPVMQVERTDTSVRYYIPGNAAAAEAGVPFMTAGDQELKAMEGKFRLTLAADTDLELRVARGGGGIRLENKNDPALPAESAGAGGIADDERVLEIVPVGVDYFDGGGRVVYSICAPFADVLSEELFERSGWRRDNSRTMLEVAIPSTDPPQSKSGQVITAWSGIQRDTCLWYLESVSGSEDTYYIMAHGTASVTDRENAKLCAGREQGGSGREDIPRLLPQKNDKEMQWIFELVVEEER